MVAVNTNSVSLAVTEEIDMGIAPVNAIAEYLEPNDISEYGASITTVTRNPISRDRQNKKGTITDFASSVSVGQDTTASSLLAFLEGAMYSTWVKRPHWLREGISAVNASAGFVLDTAMPGPLLPGTILFCRGFINGANNGLKIVAAGSTTTLIVVEGGSTLVDEVASSSVSVHVAGYQAAAGAVTVTTAGHLSNNGTFSWSDLGFEIGSAIFIGGLLSSTSFDTPENSGLARIRGVTDTILTLDKRNQIFTLDAGTGKTIHIYFGWFLRNYSVDHPLFEERTYSFEMAYPGLGDMHEDGYEYSVGNLFNTLELALPVNDKSTLSITTFGHDVDPITHTRRAWTFNNPLFTEAYSTPNDFLRLRVQNIDETGLTTFLTDATLNINNNAGGENVLGKLGPAFVNYGNFDVTMSMTAVFTNAALTSKIRNNCTVTMDFCIYNNDGAFYFDIPAMTLGDGSYDFPVNEKVKISLSSLAFGDQSLGFTISETYFPYMPSEKAEKC